MIVEMPHASVIESRDRCVYCGASMSDPGPCEVRTRQRNARNYEDALLDEWRMEDQRRKAVRALAGCAEELLWRVERRATLWADALNRWRNA